MSKLDRLGWADETSYRVGDAVFGIRSTSAEFSDWVSHALAGYRTDDEAMPFYSIVVGGSNETRSKSARGVHILYRGTTPMVRTLELKTLGSALLGELETHLFAERDDAVFTDYMAMRVDDSVAAIPSSLAPTLGRFGRRLQREGVSLGLTTHLVVELDSARVLSTKPAMRLPSSTLDGLAGPKIPGDRLVLGGEEPLRHVFVFDHEQEGHTRPISRARAVHQLSGRTFNLTRLGHRGLSALAQMTEGGSFHGLRTGDARTTLDTLVTTMREQS